MAQMWSRIGLKEGLDIFTRCLQNKAYRNPGNSHDTSKKNANVYLVLHFPYDD